MAPPVLSMCVDVAGESHARVTSPAPSACELYVNSIVNDEDSNVVNVYCSPCTSDGVCPPVISTCVDAAAESHTRVTSPNPSTRKLDVNSIGDDGDSNVVNVYCSPYASDIVNVKSSPAFKKLKPLRLAPNRIVHLKNYEM